MLPYILCSTEAEALSPAIFPSENSRSSHKNTCLCDCILHGVFAPGFERPTGVNLNLNNQKREEAPIEHPMDDVFALTSTGKMGLTPQEGNFA